jgi:hypothetical protein
MSALRTDDEFQRQLTRVDLIVESLGVVDAALEAGIQKTMEIYSKEIGEV